MKTIEQGIKERLEHDLDKMFPKGKSKSRGSALVLFGSAILELRKVIQSFGSCEHCFGKGYGTTMIGVRGYEDFGGEGFVETPTVRVSFCSCPRGKQLRELFGKAKTI
jgi:hypothetical protein